MPNEQVLIGAVVTLLCAAGLCKGRWFLANTPKGRRLVGWLGESKAIWVLRALLAIGIVFGILLATNVIRPVTW